MDFSLGEFIRLAKKEDYYNNTIFVILGDHGLGHESQPNNYGALSFHHYHVPLTIYSPGLNIAHREIDDVVTVSIKKKNGDDNGTVDIKLNFSFKKWVEEK